MECFGEQLLRRRGSGEPLCVGASCSAIIGEPLCVGTGSAIGEPLCVGTSFIHGLVIRSN